MPEQQTERVNIRITPTEAEMLRDLEEKIGLNKTDTLRQLIRRAHEAAFGASLQAAKRPKR